MSEPENPENQYEAFFQAFPPLEERKGCLSEDQLVRLARDPALAAKSDHLASCTLCRRVVDSLRVSYSEETAQLTDFLSAVRLNARQIERSRKPSLGGYLSALLGFRSAGYAALAAGGAALVLLVVMTPVRWWRAPAKADAIIPGLRASSQKEVLAQTQRAVEVLARDSESGKVSPTMVQKRLDRLSPSIAAVDTRKLGPAKRGDWAETLARLSLAAEPSAPMPADVQVMQQILRKYPQMHVVAWKDTMLTLCDPGGELSASQHAELLQVASKQGVQNLEVKDSSGSVCRASLGVY